MIEQELKDAIVKQLREIGVYEINCFKMSSDDAELTFDTKNGKLTIDASKLCKELNEGKF